jgi:hypothetical protein
MSLIVAQMAQNLTVAQDQEVIGAESWRKIKNSSRLLKG